VALIKISKSPHIQYHGCYTDELNGEFPIFLIIGLMYLLSLFPKTATVSRFYHFYLADFRMTIGLHNPAYFFIISTAFKLSAPEKNQPGRLLCKSTIKVKISMGDKKRGAMPLFLSSGSGGLNRFHTEANTTLTIYFQHFYLDHITLR
jgi:hypothetical protein